MYSRAHPVLSSHPDEQQLLAFTSSAVSTLIADPSCCACARALSSADCRALCSKLLRFPDTNVVAYHLRPTNRPRSMNEQEIHSRVTFPSGRIAAGHTISPLAAIGRPASVSIIWEYAALQFPRRCTFLLELEICQYQRHGAIVLSPLPGLP
jgi:hypothetical protein